LQIEGPQELIFNLEEVVERFRAQVSEETRRNWRSMRIGPSFITIGEAILYPLEELDRWDRRNQSYADHNAKVVHVFEAEVLRKSPGHEIEITCDTQLSIGHAAPSDVSLPAVSSFGGLRTPALVRAAPPSWDRHPQTFTDSDIEAENAGDIFGQAVRPPSGVARADR
jgi:hypothetical protein